jgi:hypothetical protein
MRRSNFVGAVTIAMILVLAAVPASAPAAAKTPAEKTVKELGTYTPTPYNYDQLTFSPSGEHFAYILSLNEKLDGPAQPGKKAKQILVCDGVRGDAWEKVQMARLNTQNWGFRGPGSGSLPPDTLITNEGFIAYQARKSPTEGFLVFAGRGGKEEVQAAKVPFYDMGASLMYTADGKHMAYIVKAPPHGFSAMVHNGVQGTGTYESISNYQMAISPDGQSVAYNFSHANDHGLMLNDKVLYKGSRWNDGTDSRIDSLTFSPDSKRLAYIIDVPGKKAVVCDGKDLTPIDRATALLFSPDSRHLVYQAPSAKDKGYALYCDGRELPRPEGAEWMVPLISPDSRRLAITCLRGEVYIQDLEEKDAKAIKVGQSKDMVINHAAFSPDSKHVAYGIAVGMSETAKWGVAIDGRPLPGMYFADKLLLSPGDGPRTEPPVVAAPGFSADGRHVYFVGASHPSPDKYVPARHFMVIDGVSLAEHDDVWIPTEFQNGAKTLRYIVRDGDKLRLIETTWPEDMTWEKAVGSPAGK